jgi:hypothetical protein
MLADVIISADIFTQSLSAFGAPSVVLFERYLLAASSLVLIFSKKISFSLGEIKKMADIVQHSH